MKFKGRIGDLSFYKSPDGYLAREKGGVDGERILTDPVFQRTRENGYEFGRAGVGAKLLRNSIRSLVKNASDRLVVGRLNKEMVRVVKADTINGRGERTISDGDITLLEGFNFNDNAKLGSIFFAPYTKSINRVTGVMDVSIDPFVSEDMISYPFGATHYQIVAAASELNFIDQTSYYPFNAFSNCNSEQHKRFVPGIRD